MIGLHCAVKRAISRGWQSFVDSQPNVSLDRRAFVEGVLSKLARLEMQAKARGDALELAAAVEAMHLADLGLAIACDRGVQGAWDAMCSHLQHHLRSGWMACDGVSHAPRPGLEA